MYQKKNNRKKPFNLIEELDYKEDSFSFTTNEQLRSKGIYYITDFIGNDNESWLDIHQDILLKHLNPTWQDDIQLIINSPGGYVSTGWALIDLLNWIRMDIRTIALGCCASLGACLACCGTLGKRFAAPNVELMIHGARLGHAEGNLHEMITITEAMRKEQEKDIQFWLSKSKYKTREQIISNFLNGQDQYFTAKEALSHGIIDGIIGENKTNKKK